MASFGNFGLSNYDRTAQVSGAGIGGRAFQPRVEDETQSRSGSTVASTADSRYSSPHKPFKDEKQLEDAEYDDITLPFRNTASTGIHDGTYYPDGLGPKGEDEGILPALQRIKTAAEQEEERETRRRHGEVLSLARRYTSQSLADVNPLNPEKDSILDPYSPNFSAKAWTKSMLNIISHDPEKFPQRTAGFAFKNLNVYGFGAATDYQKTVGNVFLEVIGIARKLLRIGQRRIDILRDFEGVVNPGDMLTVLGPPGR